MTPPDSLVYSITQDSSPFLGDFINQIDPNTIFTVSVSLSIFALGWFLTMIYEHRKEQKRLKSRLLFLNESLKSMIEPLGVQAKSFQDLSDQIKDQNIKSYLFKIATSINLKFLSSILLEDVHKLLLKHSSSAHLLIQEFTNVINSIEIQRTNFTKNFDSFMRALERNEDYSHKSLDQIFRFYDSLLKTESLKDDFISEFALTLGKWYDLGDENNSEILYLNLLIPLRNVCENRKTEQNALILLPHVIEAIYAYENIRDLRIKYEALFNNDATQINTQISTTQKIVEILDFCLKYRWYHQLKLWDRVSIENMIKEL